MTKRLRSEDDISNELQEGSSHTKPRLGTPPGSSETLPSGSTRILCWNVETPVPFLQLPPTQARSATNGEVTAGSNPRLLRDLLERHDYPDFVCLQEVRARHNDKQWIAALRLAANHGAHDSGPKYTLYHSLSRATRGQRHFGVVTYAKEPHEVVAVREVDWDAEGRVLILELQSGWALVNVYALNGSEYMWRDPLGRAAPKTRNERKREFNRLLMEECRAIQQRGLRLVLIGDFNISLTKRDCYPRLRTEYPHGLARSEFLEQFIPALDVVDVFRELHPNKKAYSWFAKGKPQGKDCARVDYALVESGLRDNVVDLTYLEDPQERGHSDHVPLLLTLKGMSGLARWHQASNDQVNREVAQQSGKLPSRKTGIPKLTSHYHRSIAMKMG
ncbi:Endonuclease/exonuclease/phosphatase [Trametes elegans]|nr:Endonuclease/exonuclease/phosphatase [Trametes elegans]